MGVERKPAWLVQSRIQSVTPRARVRVVCDTADPRLWAVAVPPFGGRARTSQPLPRLIGRGFTSPSFAKFHAHVPNRAGRQSGFEGDVCVERVGFLLAFLVEDVEEQVARLPRLGLRNVADLEQRVD